MRKLFSILSIVLLYVTIAFGQAAVDISITVEDALANSQILNFGLDLTATDGVDPGLGESDLPPPPPGNAFDARWWLPPFAGTLSTWLDFRAPGGPPAFPFTGQIEHNIKFQSTDYPITISWSLPPEIAATSVIQDMFGGVLAQASFSGTGSIVISNPAITQLQVLVDYVNIGPSGPAPEFAISPASLDFGTVALASNSLLQATISNPGTDPLIISNITSTDGQFTFTPNTFPITVVPSGTQLLDVTFTPTVLGATVADLVFTHNAPGSPTSYTVQGVGADAGPTFSVSPASLNFGNVGLGNSVDLDVTVTNNGLTNTLNITNAAIAEAEYSVTPTSAVVAPGGSQIFTVTFTPSAGGTFPGTLTFTDDAPGSPHTVALTGDGVAFSGLIFQQDSVWRIEEAFYADTMQLKGLTFPAQAIQFRLLVNTAGDDDVILTFQNILKGSDVSDPSWILDYNIFRGAITGNGASVDTIYVLLYNLNQNGGLPVGDHNNLLVVNYRVANLPALVDTSKSSFIIANEEASTFEGFPIDITPSDPELQVLGVNRVSSIGDVNGDGCMDILDLIMVVDHIVGRDSLSAAEFERADIAPWAIGASLPSPDGFVNVQDLAVIQNIILTGVFPDGTIINSCGPTGLPKFNGEEDAIVKLYINNEGITAFVDAKVGIRGAQIEFGNLVDNSEDMIITTDLGQGYHLQANDILRTLLYDRLADKYIAAGENFMADMPFQISNPEDITLERLILVDIDKNKLLKIQVDIYYSTPALPLDYILFQNYPNPFNPNTSIRFQIPQTGDVSLKVYDMLGQEVRVLFEGVSQRGTYTINWDGLNDAGVKMSSGTYIYRMISGDFVQSKKMILLK
jgi:Abnormal spindle-like microcephaly-assoc'd, ASPM-SPD-2-Hydin/HYDIN/CFA65/VesB-like, Ig-like domain/FlgD Ig-like domain